MRVATFQGLGHSQGEILKNNDHSRKLLFVQWYYSSRVHVQLQRSRHFGWKKVPVWNRCFNLSAFVKWSKQGYAKGVSKKCFIPQIAIAIGVLTSKKGGVRRTTLADWTWHQAGAIVGCHCSVLWLGGRVTTNFRGVDVVPLLGAIVACHW